jgi:hypothetical protein
MPLIRCRLGGEMLDVPDGQDPHAALDASGCRHCADGHDLDVHCGEGANTCPREHPGPCWNGEGSRPDGCAVCRPLLFIAGGGVG